jgi:Toprim domain
MRGASSCGNHTSARPRGMPNIFGSGMRSRSRCCQLLPGTASPGRGSDALRTGTTTFDEPTCGLILAEGIETGLAVQNAGLRPVWVTVGAGNLRTFPVLGDIESLTIAADPDAVGQQAAAVCAERWRRAGREAVIITPPGGGDWADPASEVAA